MVVTDAEDHDRIVAEVVGDHAELHVIASADHWDTDASVLVHAGVDRDVGTTVGIQLWGGGNSVAELTAWYLGAGRWDWMISGIRDD